jgi:hypothetical protein
VLRLKCPGCGCDVNLALVEPGDRPERKQVPLVDEVEGLSARSQRRHKRARLLDLLKDLEVELGRQGAKVDEAALHRNHATAAKLEGLLTALEQELGLPAVPQGGPDGEGSNASDDAARHGHKPAHPGQPPPDRLFDCPDNSPARGVDNSVLEGNQERQPSTPPGGQLSELVAAAVDAIAGTNLLPVVQAGRQILRRRDSRPRSRPSPKLARDRLFDRLFEIVRDRWLEGRTFVTLTYPGGDRRATTLPETALYEMVRAWDYTNRQLRKEHNGYSFIRINSRHEDGHYHMHIMFFGETTARSFLTTLKRAWEGHCKMGYVVRRGEADHQTPEALTQYLLSNLERSTEPGRRAFSTSNNFYGDKSKRKEVAQLIEDFLHTRDTGKGGR